MCDVPFVAGNLQHAPNVSPPTGLNIFANFTQGLRTWARLLRPSGWSNAEKRNCQDHLAPPPKIFKERSRVLDA